MAKRFFTVIVSVLLVLSIAFSLSNTSKAAGWAGAYRTKDNFLVNVPCTMVGDGTNSQDYSSQNYSCACIPIYVAKDTTFVAGADGIIYIDGQYPFHVSSFLAAGKMFKLP